MSTVVSTRHNGVTNPEAIGAFTGLGGYSQGTSETGASTLVTGAVDGPLPQITTYARWTVTTAKTAGSTGWKSESSPYRAPLSGVAGSKVTTSVYMRYTGTNPTTNVVMRADVYSAAGSQINTADSASISLPTGVWVRLSSTITAAADFATTAWWAYQTSGFILPVGATLDVTGALSEPGAVLGSWFDGNTANTLDNGYSPAATVAYTWDGATNASTSTMTETAPLQDFQIQLTDGTIAGAGTAVGYLEASGIRDAAGARSADSDRAGVDGSVPGLSLLTGRTVGVKWLIAAPAIGVEAALQILSRNWQNIIDPSSVCMTAGDYLVQTAAGGARPVSALQFQLPGRPVPILALGKPGRLSAPVDSKYQFGWLEADSDWVVPDGKLYDATVNSSTAGLPSSLGGARFPWTFPVNFGPSTGGTLQAVNDGKYPAKPVLKITGPVTNPKIISAATGQYIRVNLALQAADVLIIDTGSRVVRLNGVNRNNALDVGSSFFTIPPGGTSLTFASTDGGTVAGAATVYTLNTYSAI